MLRYLLRCNSNQRSKGFYYGGKSGSTLFCSLFTNHFFRTQMIAMGSRRRSNSNSNQRSDGYYYVGNRGVNLFFNLSDLAYYFSPRYYKTNFESESGKQVRHPLALPSRAVQRGVATRLISRGTGG